MRVCGHLYALAIWLTQWGSCSLGQQGYSPIEILRYYYGDSIYINTAEQIAGIPASWPGYDLTVGSSGDKVRQLQEQLDANNFYAFNPSFDNPCKASCAPELTEKIREENS